jgi:hypothetical protein
MDVRHAVFETLVAQPEAMYQSLARVETGVFQPGYFAGHARSVIVRNRRLDAIQRSCPSLVGGRVRSVDENLAIADSDLIGANRIAADQRFAVREIEFPVVPVAGQYASRPKSAFAQRIALMRAAIGNRKQTIPLCDDEDLLTPAAHELVAVDAEIAALQSRCGKHRLPPFDRSHRKCRATPRRVLR